MQGLVDFFGPSALSLCTPEEDILCCGIWELPFWHRPCCSLAQLRLQPELSKLHWRLASPRGSKKPRCTRRFGSGSRVSDLSDLELVWSPRATVAVPLSVQRRQRTSENSASFEGPATQVAGLFF